MKFANANFRDSKNTICQTVRSGNIVYKSLQTIAYIKKRKEDVMKRIDFKDFVTHFCWSRNAEESAMAVGVSPLKAKIEGLKMLSRRSTKNAIDKKDEHSKISDNEITAGLERLAFGRTNDVISLAFSEEITPQQLMKADLFNVSEIKKVKGGGVEIKFFDRQKALERLWDYKEKLYSRGNALALVEALKNDDTKISIDDSPLGDEDNGE